MLSNLAPVLGLIAFVVFLCLLDAIKKHVARRYPDPMPGPAPPPAPSPPVDPDERDALEVLRLQNEFRIRNGREPLLPDPHLTAAAVGHARHMASVYKMGHMFIGDGDPFSRIKAAGFRYSYAGENIAETPAQYEDPETGELFDAHTVAQRGLTVWPVPRLIVQNHWSVETVMEMWERDLPHRMNMESREYTHVGVGVAQDGAGTRYWCVDFGRPA